MKKQLLCAIIISMSIGAAFAKIVTEKDIGPCIARNAAGFCSESKTHYCASFSKVNGRCEVWYDKSKSQNANTLDQFFTYQNAMNEGIKKYNQAQAKLDKPYTDAMLKEFPRIQEFGKKRVALEQELNNLNNKSSLGINVDKNKISLLNFQIRTLEELQNHGIHISKPTNIAYENTSINILSSRSIEDNYVNSMRNLDNALKTGKINQAEYNEGKNSKLTEFKTDYNTLIDLYDKLISLSQVPEESPNYWLELNCDRNSQNIGKFNTSNTKNKIQKINNRFNNGVNMINNTMNGVNSVRGMFGL